MLLLFDMYNIFAYICIFGCSCVCLSIFAYVRAYSQLCKNAAQRNLLQNEHFESFWDTLWLELWPFLYFIVESRRIACRCLQTKRGAICYRMSVSTPSGTPCGSSYGRFCIGCHLLLFPSSLFLFSLLLLCSSSLFFFSFLLLVSSSPFFFYFLLFFSNYFTSSLFCFPFLILVSSFLFFLFVLFSFLLLFPSSLFFFSFLLLFSSLLFSSSCYFNNYCL